MRKLLLALAMLSCVFGAVQAQKTQSFAYPSEKAWLITNKPQTFLLGFNVGAEYVISKKLSWHSEVTNHLYTSRFASSAVSTSLKWHFLGKFGKSIYLQPKLVAGFFYDETPMEDKPYYAGFGIGLGGMHTISKNKRWFLFYEAGIKACNAFGNRPNSTPINPENEVNKTVGAMEYFFISPASIFDLSIGISYRF